MPKLSQYELEREANIAKNKVLLDELELKQAVKQLLPAKITPPPKTKAKPIQPAKKATREAVAPTRQSARLRKSEVVDPNESPSKKRKREAEQEKRRKEEEEDRLEAEEQARVAKRPRHQDLELSTLAENAEELELSSLNTALEVICHTRQPKRVGDPDLFVFDKDKKDEAAASDLRQKLKNLRVVARAKVTDNRVYSAAYHPEITKDLIFFGDKHGQLGIWDARAAPDDVTDEDENPTFPEDQEGGKYWRLQAHWPASPKSSISCIKFDPIDSHSLYTSSYDCTIRSLSFTSGVSREIFSTDDALISSIDLPPNGNEMWISDALGGVTHLDLREDRSKARWYGLSEQKIGSISVNPTKPCFLLTASNSRLLKLWDSRKLQGLAVGTLDAAGPPTPPPSSPGGPPYSDSVSQPEFPLDVVTEFASSKRGKGCLRATSEHTKSVTAAYWDPRGRSIVSTSYDDKLRLWDVNPERYKGDSILSSFNPFCRISHNCQTGKWLTLLRAQWSPNPDVYPHFTIGNMDHSLDIFSGKGTLIARLADRKRITAVQAVTCSHPSVLERAASGNGSGRCVLWAPPDV